MDAAITGLGYYAPNPDPGDNLGYPEITRSGRVLIATATVAMNVGDVALADGANPGNVTKSTTAASYPVVGVVVGSYVNHQPNFNVGPAAGQHAIVQVSGFVNVVVDVAVTAGEALVASSNTAGYAGAAANPAAVMRSYLGIAMANQGTAGQPVLVSLGNSPANSKATAGVSATLFTAGGVYTPTSGTTYLRVTLYGGSGGGGGGYTTTYTGGAGAPGGIVRALLAAAHGPFTVVVGAAGAGGAVSTAGTAGGNSSIKDANGVNTLIAGGGGGGGAGTSTANGAAGTAATNTATSDAVVAPSIDLNSTSLGVIGGAGGAVDSAGASGVAGLVLVEAF